MFTVNRQSDAPPFLGFIHVTFGGGLAAASHHNTVSLRWCPETTALVEITVGLPATKNDQINKTSELTNCY